MWAWLMLDKSSAELRLKLFEFVLFNFVLTESHIAQASLRLKLST